MTVHTSPDGTVVLKGICPAEDAEDLLQALLARPGVLVDWRACEAAHSAVIQVIMVARPPLSGPPAGQALRDWLQPFLTRDDNVNA